LHTAVTPVCTLIAFHRVWEDAPLVLAVNRDEEYDRPAAPPAVTGAATAILTPRDERAGGTWMGANAGGLWVGLTNRDGEREDPLRRSRGLLCMDLLGETGPEAVVDRLRDPDRAYNPFSLVAGDASSLWIVEHAGGRSIPRRLAPGVHLVTNRPFEAMPQESKVERARRRLEEEGLWPEGPGGLAPDDLEERLAAVIGDHGVHGHDALCLHGGRYGTRSGAVWRIGTAGSSGEAALLAYADGPPCSTRFRRFRLPSMS
jgi:uncharacterized protein with NRDE domain